MGVYITGRGVLSPAGHLRASWQRLAEGIPYIKFEEDHGYLGRLDSLGERYVQEMREDKRLKKADRAVLMGIYAAREAYREAGSPDKSAMGAIIGSSRGATGLLEQQHERFLNENKVAVTTSPQTTGGIFASAIAQDLQLGGPALFVSSACSTGLNAIGTAYAMIEAGLCEKAVAGGAEASLTPFTLTQLQAVGVMAKKPSALFPCQPFHERRAGLVPAEGAACLMLEAQPTKKAMVRILGFGGASEVATATGISPEGKVMELAVRRALQMAGRSPGEVDLIVGHGAGTVKGDAAELTAYRQIFGNQLPPITGHKWLTGHMIGASSAFSVALAIQHLLENRLPPLPYLDDDMPEWLSGRRSQPSILRSALITALGFGGSAAALLIERC